MKQKITDGRKRRSHASQQSILAAAKEIFLEHGYNNNSMMDISRQAGVGYGTLYTHFSGKDDILNHLIDEIADDFSKIVNIPYTPQSSQDVETRISQEIIYLLQLAKKHRDLLKVTYEATGQSDVVREHWNGIFQKHIDKSIDDYSYSIEKGLAKSGFEKRIVAQSIVYMVKEFFWAVVLGKEDDIETISKNVTSLFLYGVYR